ncbi:hypothetical protein AMTR_s00026p00230300 [Amborella trichopoda]|uniref:Uncharacterized protein n=1 Tax=Amborella trichopoda TaxID=13333 RepID=W1PRI6_AMBTC|nr:hypothetical protein AMTR_s00026p00230300 [Amborella trichopoda]
MARGDKERRSVAIGEEGVRREGRRRVSIGEEGMRREGRRNTMIRREAGRKKASNDKERRKRMHSNWGRSEPGDRCREEEERNFVRQAHARMKGKRKRKGKHAYSKVEEEKVVYEASWPPVGCMLCCVENVNLPSMQRPLG